VAASRGSNVIPAKGSIFKKVKKNAALENLESGAA
jgi:hypothetical protein